MRIYRSLACVVALGFAFCAVEAHAQKEGSSQSAGLEISRPERQEVSFRAADGVTLFADVYWQNTSHEGPLVLLFHQAGASARGEYTPIIPRLLDRGISVLALDQRSGGGRFGGTNRTVAHLADSAKYDYCQAYPDLEAALAYGIEQGNRGPRVAWGSSYSAALVIRLGAEHSQELDGLLAFSPANGPAMGDCSPERYAAQVDMPVLILRPSAEMKRQSVVDQLEFFQQFGFDTYVAPHGVHGSSMLVKDRVGADVEANWNVVLEFLDLVLKPPAPIR